MKLNTSFTPFNTHLSTILLLATISLFSPQFVCGKGPHDAKARATEMEEKVLEAQQKVFEQLRQMGIEIDPNKEMSDDAINQMQDETLNKARSLQTEIENQLTTMNNSPEHKDVTLGTIPPKEEVFHIADRFFQDSYQQLTVIEKTQFDNDFKIAKEEKFSPTSVRKLANKGAALITFGNNHHLACVYITSAVKAIPTDVVNLNNFGAYLRIIDSLEISLPVLLYANQLLPGTPAILTHVGCSLLELGDEVKAEMYLQLAIKQNPAFGQAHTALCEVYIRQKKFKEALVELFAGVKGRGPSYMQASRAMQQIQQGYENSSGNEDDLRAKEEFWNETLEQLKTSRSTGTRSDPKARVKMPAFPDCKDVADWTFGGGYAGAVMSYKGFNDYTMSFAEQFQKLHKKEPNIPANGIPRDFPNEMFALDCITDMFINFSIIEYNKHYKQIEAILQKAQDASELHLKNQSEYLRVLRECTQKCMQIHSSICNKECERKFCEAECQNAKKYNAMLQTRLSEITRHYSKFACSINKLRSFLS